MRYLFEEWFGKKSAKELISARMRARLYDIDVIGLWKIYRRMDYARVKLCHFTLWQRKYYFAEDRYTCISRHSQVLSQKLSRRSSLPFFFSPRRIHGWAALIRSANERLIKMNDSAMIGEWKSCSPCKWSTSAQPRHFYISQFSSSGFLINLFFSILWS